MKLKSTKIVLRSKEIRANINDLECELEELLELRSDIEDDITEIEYMDSEPAEIFEWWIVSSFLVDKLKRMGHPVLEQENIWGRCTSGQAIYMDYAIRQIAENMEILCGQRYQWTV